MFGLRSLREANLGRTLLSVLAALSLLVSTVPVALSHQAPTGVTKASAAYHESRFTETAPVYALAKVRKLIKGIKPTKINDDESSLALSAKVFEGLSVQAKFTYCMIHGEVSTQNCDMMPAIVGEENKIFARIPGAFDSEQSWSDRQTSFMEKHRETLIDLIRATIKSQHQVGVNLKHAILELDASSLIPDLVAVYKQTHQRDNDILTVCCLLMKSGKYKPFVTSQSYRKLYGDENASYKSYIEGNDANKALTIQRAMAFYKTRKG